MYLFVYMQAIALSLQDSAGFLNLADKVPMQGTDADSTKSDSSQKASLKKVSNEKASLKKASNEKEVGTCNQEDATSKRKRKQQVCFIIYFTKSMKILKLSHTPSSILGYFTIVFSRQEIECRWLRITWLCISFSLMVMPSLLIRFHLVLVKVISYTVFGQQYWKSLSDVTCTSSMF